MEKIEGAAPQQLRKAAEQMQMVRACAKQAEQQTTPSPQNPPALHCRLTQVNPPPIAVCFDGHFFNVKEVSMRHKSTTSLVLAIAVLGLSACSTVVPPTVEKYTPPPVGASWEVVQKATGSYGADTRYKVTRGPNFTWQGREVLPFIGPQTQTLVDPVTGRWIAVTRLDGTPVMTFDPPLGWDHPVAVGKTYARNQTITLPGPNRTINFAQTCSVLGYEKVTVMAGTFDTFRIRCTTTAGNDETHWIAPSLGPFVKQKLVRSAASPSGPGTQDSELASYSPPKK